MAVPKRKPPRPNTRPRRPNWKALPAVLTTSPRCSKPTPPHQACPSCGMYKGRHFAEAERTEHQA